MWWKDEGIEWKDYEAIVRMSHKRVIISSLQFPTFSGDIFYLYIPWVYMNYFQGKHLFPPLRNIRVNNVYSSTRT